MGPFLTIPQVESLHIEGLEASLRQRIMAQDADAVLWVLELAVLYSKSAPYSVKMLQMIADDYKGKVVVLEKSHNKASTV